MASRDSRTKPSNSDTAKARKTQRSVSRNIDVEAEVHATPDGVQSNRKNGYSIKNRKEDGAGSLKVVRFEDGSNIRPKSRPKPATLQTDTGSKRGTDKQKGAAEKPRGRKIPETIPEVSVDKDTPVGTGGTNLPNSQVNQPLSGRATGTKPKAKLDSNSNLLNAKAKEALELVRTRSPVGVVANAFNKVIQVQGHSLYKQEDAKSNLKLHEIDLQKEEIQKKRMSIDRNLRNHSELLERLAEEEKNLDLKRERELVMERERKTKRILEPEFQDLEGDGLESEDEEGPLVQRGLVKVDVLRDVNMTHVNSITNSKFLTKALSITKSAYLQNDVKYAGLMFAVAYKEARKKCPAVEFIFNVTAIYENEAGDESQDRSAASAEIEDSGDESQDRSAASAEIEDSGDESQDRSAASAEIEDSGDESQDRSAASAEIEDSGDESQDRSAANAETEDSGDESQDHSAANAETEDSGDVDSSFDDAEAGTGDCDEMEDEIEDYINRNWKKVENLMKKKGVLEKMKRNELPRTPPQEQKRQHSQ